MIIYTIGFAQKTAPHTYEYKDYYKILPQIYGIDKDATKIKDGKAVSEGFVYSSNGNKDWMTIEELRKWIADNKDKVGEI